MHALYRVFGANALEPEPAGLLHFLMGFAQDSEGHFQGDDLGWFRLRVVRGETEMRIERYQTSEEGIRAELNTWAAWVEASGESPEKAELMRRLITTQQVMVLHDFPEELAGRVCREMARLTDGVFQVDGRGFFTADGTPLLSE